MSLCLLPCGASPADRSSVTAALDAGCRPLPAKLVVPSEMKAARMAGVFSSSWLPCGGGGHAKRIGFRIMSPTGQVLAQVTQSYARRDDPPEDGIMALELGPGSYPVEISEGGPLTKVVVSFELIGANQPTSGILPPGMEAAPKGEPAFVGGEWSDHEVKSRAVVAQKGDAITIVNSFLWKGKRIEWRGEGIVEGTIVRFAFTYATGPPPGFENGTMELKLVSPGRLVGFWRVASGNYSRNIRFDLIRAAKEPKRRPKQKTPSSLP